MGGLLLRIFPSLSRPTFARACTYEEKYGLLTRLVCVRVCVPACVLVCASVVVGLRACV